MGEQLDLMGAETELTRCAEATDAKPGLRCVHPWSGCAYCRRLEAEREAWCKAQEERLAKETYGEALASDRGSVVYRGCLELYNELGLEGAIAKCEELELGNLYILNILRIPMLNKHVGLSVDPAFAHEPGYAERAEAAGYPHLAAWARKKESSR